MRFGEAKMFHKHPKDAVVLVGAMLILLAEALYKSTAKIQWQVDTGKGWEDLSGECGKRLIIKDFKAADVGSYRVLCDGTSSRPAKVSLVGSPVEAEAFLGTPTDDVLLEILEGTGKDLNPTQLPKIMAAITKKMPDTLKE